MEENTDSIEIQNEDTPDIVTDNKIYEKTSENSLNAPNNSHAEKNDSRDAQDENSQLQVELDNLSLKSNSGSSAQIQENKSKQNSTKTSRKNGVQLRSNESVSSSSSGEEILQTRFSVSNKNVALEEEYSENSNSSVSLSEKSDNKHAEYESNVNGTIFSVNDKTEVSKEYANNRPISPAEESDNECASDHNPEINATIPPISQKNKSYKIELDNNCNSISSENILYESNDDSKKSNTSPIIIQAKACDKSSGNENDNSNSKIKQPKVSHDSKKLKTDLTTEDSPSVDVSNSTTEVRNSTPITNDHLNYKKKNARRNSNKSDVLEELLEKISAISESDSININYAKYETTVSDEFIVEDFLNGSLDLSSYNDKKLSNNMKKSIASGMQHETNKTVMKTNMNAYKNNAFTREMGSSLFQDDNLSNTKNTSNTPNKTLKRRQPVKKSGRSTKKARTTLKKKNMNVASDNSMEVDLKLKSELENISGNTRQAKRQKIFKADGNTRISNKFNKQNKTVDNRSKIKRSTPMGKNMKERNSLLNSPMQESGRKRRNSSLIASKKIKEIEELENAKSIEEICIDSEDETPITSILGKLESKKAGKQKHQTENILYRGDLSYKNTPEEDDESLEFYSSNDYKTENKKLVKNIFKNTFKDYSKHDKNSTKHLDLYDDNFMHGDEELYKKLHTDKRDYSSKYSLGSNRSGIFSTSKNSIVNKGESTRNEIPHIDTYKGPITRNQRKTWDTLEKELLGEPEKETVPSHDVDKTAILKLSKLVKNQDQEKDNASYTLTNAIMQTVGRNTEENKCNMQYQISTGNKYLRSKRKSYEYSNDLSNPQSTGIVSNYSKSTDIVEKSIAAMKKCTSQFDTPKASSSENEEEVSQFEEVSDYSNASHEAMIQSNITFMRKENKHYYKNEIVGYLKKSIRSTNSNNTEKENSDNAEHFNENNFVVKSFSFRNLIEKKVDEANKKVVPVSGVKYTNPWDKLIRELSPDNENAYLKEISNEENAKVISKPLIHRNESNKILNKRQKNKPKIMNIENNSNTEDEKSCSHDEQESTKVMESTEKELIVDHATDSEIFANFSINADATPKGHDQKKISNPEDNSTMKILETSKMKSESYKRRGTKVQTRKSSPKFKLQVAKNGSLKLKKQSSRSSSVTSSEEYTYKGQNNKFAARENEAKDKYKRYLLKLFDKEDEILKSLTDDQDKIHSTNVMNKEHKNFVDKSRNQKMKVLKLIAQKDDDVFSLSSSDSEHCSKDKKGSGDLCDLFDE